MFVLSFCGGDRTRTCEGLLPYAFQAYAVATGPLLHNLLLMHLALLCRVELQSQPSEGRILSIELQERVIQFLTSPRVSQSVPLRAFLMRNSCQGWDIKNISFSVIRMHTPSLRMYFLLYIHQYFFLDNSK